MLYSRELLGLMRPFPGRRFQMGQLVGFVLRGDRDDPRAKAAARKAIRRVLDRLHAEGFVVIEEATRRGAGARYCWRVEMSHSVQPEPAEVG